MRDRIQTVVLVGAALAAPVSGQFSFGSVDASAGYEGIFDPPGSLTPTSSATDASLSRSASVPYGVWAVHATASVDRNADMAREAEVLWSERDVPAASLERLLDAVTVESHDQDEPGHRLIVYVVVAVTGTTMKIEQQAEVEPRCCCGEVLCP